MRYKTRYVRFYLRKGYSPYASLSTRGCRVIREEKPKTALKWAP